MDCSERNSVVSETMRLLLESHVAASLDSITNEGVGLASQTLSLLAFYKPAGNLARWRADCNTVCAKS